MKSITFKIFKEKHGFVFTTEMFVFSGIFSSLTFTLIVDKYFHEFYFANNIHKYMTPIVIGFAFLWPVMYIASFARKQKLRGHFDGKLELKLNEIIVNHKSYLLKDIKTIDFQANDFKDRFESSTKTFNPRCSQGVNNLCTIQLNSGNKIEIKFLQEFEGKLKQNEELIVHYFKENKITFLKMTEILGLKTYAEIQAFKQKHNH